MNTVFVLQHRRGMPSGEDDTKFIGVYRNESSARAAFDRLKTQPGFCEFPMLFDDSSDDHGDGFHLSEYELDKDHWTEGFFTAPAGPLDPKHGIAWFDLPANDLDRAVRFYSAVLNAPVNLQTIGDVTLGMVPGPNGELMGCLVANKNSKPSSDGVMIWIRVNARLRDAVEAVRTNGGTVQLDIHAVGSYGFRAQVLDSEGNCIALYAETNS